MGKSRWNHAGMGHIFLAAALAGGLIGGSPVWAGVSENTVGENLAVIEGRMATSCDSEKRSDVKSGGERAEELYASGTEAILPEPYRRGYVFIEWNTEPDGSGEFYGAGEIVRITDMTLYAVWEKEETESLIPMEPATASNAKKATESNAERLETAETKEASGQEQDMEPEEKTDAKRNGISEVKRATESNAKRTALSEETEAEPKAIEKENQK